MSTILDKIKKFTVIAVAVTSLSLTAVRVLNPQDEPKNKSKKNEIKKEKKETKELIDIITSDEPVTVTINPKKIRIIIGLLGSIISILGGIVGVSFWFIRKIKKKLKKIERAANKNEKKSIEKNYHSVISKMRAFIVLVEHITSKHIIEPLNSFGKSKLRKIKTDKELNKKIEDEIPKIKASAEEVIKKTREANSLMDKYEKE